MDRRALYKSLHTNIDLLKSNGIPIGGEYICPLCMKHFSEADVRQSMTEEDVPQHSLGGKRITITCRTCNSTCGSDIDIHLYNAIKIKEQQMFLPHTDRNVHIEKDGERLNATLKIDDNQNTTLHIDTKRNSPRTWSLFQNNILLPDAMISVADHPLKHSERRISSAMIKNAYLLLFARTGYTFLADQYYDILREQIFDPERYLLPERLWTAQEIMVKDGIYITQDNRYRGFFVVYTLSLKLTYKICVLIPTPQMPYLFAAKELQKITAGDSIKVKELPPLDYLEDKVSISRLTKWVYGWNMDL